MHRITLSFTPINGRHVTALGLQGLLFNVLRHHDIKEATWLHGHPAPKPFALIPLYSEAGELAGLRLSVISERAAHLIQGGWQRAWSEGRPLRLGYQEFRVGDMSVEAAPSFAQLASLPPVRQVALSFLSPTAFKQGPGSLPLPVPGNVFSWPVKVWQSFAPPLLTLPADWLDWCAQDVFVVQHQIQTVTVNVSRNETFTGFVGEVQFRAENRHPQSELYLHAWQGLAGLAAFSGVGRKTTMGMGAVEIIGR